MTDPDTWASFALAQTQLQRAATYAPATLPMTAGVGILIAPPLVFVDLDDAVWTLDGGTRAMADWVRQFVESCARVGAYTEWSASGEGLHALVRTSPAFPTLTRNRFTRSGGLEGPIGIEVYSHARFCALTGVRIRDARPGLNEPGDGDALLTAFLHELNSKAAPVLSAPLATPISVPPPSTKVREVTTKLAQVPRLAAAFADPQAAYSQWAKDREVASLDPSLSAWRFALYSEAARHSPISPQPVYELFNPKGEPAHPGIPEWQQFSGYLRKPHRVYADIQRAHALIVEEHRLLAQDLGEAPPPSHPPPPHAEPSDEHTASWAQLGLIIGNTKRGAMPLPTTLNFIRIISRHPIFQQWKIERNQLDGTTCVNRRPVSDTFATRLLEPLRAVLMLNTDPPIQAVRDSIEVVADDTPFDPIQEYLRGLPKFIPGKDVDFYKANPVLGEKPLLSGWLQEVGATPSTDLERFSRRILMGLVARGLRPGIKFDTVPVLEGEEGLGKSTLIEHLVSTPFYGVHREPLHSKDAIAVMRGKWGVELAEMVAFKKSDVEMQKSFFSTASDTFRPPYGRAAITVQRRTVMFGSTNDRQYLTWGSGIRRYWPIQFEDELDIKWFDDNRDALFAEALYYFEAGEPIYDTRAEHQSEGRRSALGERMMTPAWQMRLLEHLRALPIPKLGEGGSHGALTPSYVAQLQRTLDLPSSVQHMSDTQLASFLHRAEFTHKTFAYRIGHSSMKKYLWLHPAYKNLTDDQTRAFLACFPGLFKDEVPPPHWEMLREEHLDEAVENLKSPMVEE